jgi:hypothetical protein
MSCSVQNFPLSSEYLALEIVSKTLRGEIWVGDLQGCLVQKATGTLNTSLLRGDYVVEFKLGGTCYPLSLQCSLQTTQAAIEQGPTCVRPAFALGPDESAA